MVADTEVPGIDTVHGRVDFLQLVGVTHSELDWVASESPHGAAERAQELTTRIAADNNPLLATDLSRTNSYERGISGRQIGRDGPARTLSCA